MNTTQQHLAVRDIHGDILILKDGGGALVLQVSAVNFGLLSEREQMAIIQSFAQMLNSLSFSLQIVIHSERLNLSSYLTLLEKAQKAQTNPLLSQMITDYKQFIQSVVKDMEVLDKKFYIIIPLFSIELGLTASKANLEQKIKTVLTPRKDQVIRQLQRVGLQAVQLDKAKLIEVFYDIYNGEQIQPAESVQLQDLAVRLKNPQPSQAGPQANIPPPIQQPTPQPVQAPTATQTARNHPFIVEELEA